MHARLLPLPLSAAQVAKVTEDVETSGQPLSLVRFSKSERLRKRFRTFAFFDTPDEFELFFDVLKAFCPLDKLQYWRGVGSKSGERDRSKQKGGRKATLEPIDQLLFTMVQLRAVPYHCTCCALFGVDESAGASYFTTWVRLMEEALLYACPVDAELQKTLEAGVPTAFSELFGTRHVLQTFDCAHWEMQSPSDEYARKECFSKYWGCCAGKWLMSLSCLGSTLPPSRVYPGRITDPQITDAYFEKVLGPKPDANGPYRAEEFRKEGVLFADTHVLADKGWVDYVKATLERGILFITPDKKRTGADQFTEDDSLWTQDVAHLRIHVERIIKHTREFRILNTRCSILRKDLMSSIVTVCALLQNFRAPVGGSDFGLRGADGKRVCAWTLTWGARSSA
jgi:hypothetical protein